MSNENQDTQEHSPYDEADQDRTSLNVFGRDLSKIQCFKSSFINGIGAGAVSGIAYNLATSRPPWRLSFWTYVAVTSASFVFCRVTANINKQNFRMMQSQMNDYNLLKDTELGKELDEKWAKDALNKKTNVRDFREDALTDKDSPGLVR